MKRSYDKILLLLGVLALVASAAFYLFSEGPEPDETIEAAKAKGAAFTPLPIPSLNIADAAWPEAAEQSTGWIYDVFTPPKIYINLETGEWVSEGWKPRPPSEPFGLYLAKLEQALYRIQLMGYIEEDFKDATKSLLLMVDEESGENLRVRVGDAPEGYDIEVIDFTIDRIFGDDGSITKRAMATIMDYRNGETIELIHGKPYYTEGVEILLRSSKDPSQEWKPNAIGATFERDQRAYRLTDIDFEALTLTVEKTFVDGEREAETQLLAVEASNDASAPNETDTKPTATDLNTTPFDSMF
ncbi:MAG: Uncharacterised protein [Opitutia bacterium UBA7350]|nr:MAG: Uncharacterised protein [Opitutae bacterium UBA7350]